jgi:hypothetical protein
VSGRQVLTEGGSFLWDNARTQVWLAWTLRPSLRLLLLAVESFSLFPCFVCAAIRTFGSFFNDCAIWVRPRTSPELTFISKVFSSDHRSGYFMSLTLSFQCSCQMKS